MDNLTIGKTKKFVAIAEYVGGKTEDVSESAIWAINDPKAATVTAGLVTGLADCLCAVTVKYGGKTAVGKLRVWSWVLVKVSVLPSSPGIYLGDSIRLGASATYSNGMGELVTASAAFASWEALSGGSVVSLVPDKYGAAALVLGKAPGAEKVRATYDGLSGEATVTVTDHSLTGLDVSPYAATIFTKGVANLIATLRFKDGTSTDVTSSATWTSSDPKVADVKAGTATGIAPGTVTITAAASGQTGKSTITVTPPP